MKKKKTNTDFSLETDSSKPIEDQESSEQKALKGVEKKADSLLTIALRAFSALLPSFFLTGILSGFLEGYTGLTLEFGTVEFFLISVPQVILFYYLFNKWFSYLGLFEHPDNPDFDT